MVAAGAHDEIDQPLDPHVLRRRLGLTQAGFARLVGVTRGTVVRWEHGVEPAPAAAARLRQIAPGLPRGHRSQPTATNLPHGRDALVGREPLLAEVAAALERSRLVTLTGTGGIGKTRLAQAVGWASLERFVDGVWLVELAATSDAQEVPAAVVSALSMRDTGGDLSDAIGAHLGDRRVLLIIDNCEHQLAPVGALVQTILDRCPEVVVLATSREPLNLRGEARVAVPGLSLRLGEDGSATDTSPSAAVRLFEMRAQAQSGARRFSDAQRRVIETICERLDGIPLALELAAPWVDALSVEEIQQRLDNRFALLVRGRRDSPERHSTLAAALDWSFGLLDAHERDAFLALGAFPASFDVAAASSILDADADAALAMLGTLTEKSLLMADVTTSPVRYRMHETTRLYARERSTGHRLDGALDRLAAHFVQRALATGEAFRTGGQAAPLSDVALCLDSYRTAMRLLAERDDWDGYLSIAVNLWHYWNIVGAATEACSWLQLGLSHDHRPPATAALRAFGLTFLGQTLWRLAKLDEARELFGEGFRIFDDHDDHRGRAFAQSTLGGLELTVGNYEAARPLYVASLRAFRRHGHEAETALVLNNLGHLTDREGDRAAAVVLLEECIATARRIGHELRLCIGLHNLATCAERDRDIALSRPLRRELLDVAEPLGVPVFVGLAEMGLAFAALIDDDLPEADALGAAALAQLAPAGFRDGEAAVLSLLGTIARHRHDVAASVGFHEQAITIRQHAGDIVGVAQSLVAIARVAVDAGNRADARRWFACGSAVGTRGTFTSFEDDDDVALAVAMTPPAHDGARSPVSTSALMRVADDAAQWCRTFGMRTSATRPTAGVEAKLSTLSERERQVLNLLVAGLLNKQIAAALDLSPHTVAGHVANTYRKLGVRNRADAVRVTLS